MMIKTIIKSAHLHSKSRKKITGSSQKSKYKASMMAGCLSALVTQSAVAVCEISANDRYEFIQSISLNGSALSNGANIADGDLLELTPGYSGYAYRNDWHVWLDLNNDGDFADANELIFNTSSASNTLVSASINIPNNINANSTSMRVVFHADDINADSCGYDGYGDSKDITVNLGGGSTGGGSSDYELQQVPKGGSNEHISSVLINSDEYSSGNDNGYADFTAKQTFSISDGDNITLTPNSSWDGDWAVWIDSDNNGSFDSDEKIFSASGRRGRAVSGTVDLSQIDDGIARMRVAMNGDGEANATGFTWGEIEDYTAEVHSGGSTGGGNTGGGSSGGEDKLYGSHVQWLHDNVNVKIFKFEFTDVDLTWSDSRIKSEMNEIVTYFDEQSYGSFAVTYEIHEEVIQINSRKSDWDGTTSSQWRAYIEETLIDLGEKDYNDIDDNTIYLALAPEFNYWAEIEDGVYGWRPHGIKAGVNPGTIRVYDTGDVRSQAGGIAHEMGHAMGLHHAQGIDGQETIFGVGHYESERIQYGNPYDLMGNRAWEFGSLNLYYKNFFKTWNIKSYTPEVTQSGTYRIYALEQDALRSDRDIGLRLKSGNGDYTYWLEYRTGDGADLDGIQVNIEGYFPDEDDRSYYYGVSYLLDFTPYTFVDDLNDEHDDFDDFYDGALMMDKSYTDEWGRGFTIKTVNRGGTEGTTGAWIEVQVTMH
ncbi:GspH/FimT family protein [Litorilituus sediminis]|uniref:GEVED domain-containing protein n=1 Tax=Litorilituus sediminis TaxID=718192 RepID=A0A4P6P735_9GAMM|nr:GspH/FimT family protein [Litorilituus sediminis]QBG37334.1 hypothetical protein EMK97_17110 [Litorilituus sediminis]